MTIRFAEIGDRLRAFRLGSGLSADEVAGRIGISRTALYRFEKGEVAKIEALEKLADLLDVSVPTLLGVGVEYIGSAVSYFERLRQIEETSEHIVVLAGPISFLLASNAFLDTLEAVLAESIPDGAEDRDGALSLVGDLMGILRARKASYRNRKPGVLNLVSEAEMGRFLRNGLVGRLDLPAKVVADRLALARTEAMHLVALMESQPIGVQIGLVPNTLPPTSFQIFRQPDRRLLTLSPFRLGEQPNIHAGVAMITSAPEALALHDKTVEDLWRRAHKGPAAADTMRDLIARHGN